MRFLTPGSASRSLASPTDMAQVRREAEAIREYARWANHGDPLSEDNPHFDPYSQDFASLTGAQERDVYHSLSTLTRGECLSPRHAKGQASPHTRVQPSRQGRPSRRGHPLRRVQRYRPPQGLASAPPMAETGSPDEMDAGMNVIRQGTQAGLMGGERRDYPITPNPLGRRQPSKGARRIVTQKKRKIPRKR